MILKNINVVNIILLKIFKYILNYSLEGTRFLYDIEVQCLGYDLSDETLDLHIVNKEKVESFKGYMISVIRKYGIITSGEHMSFIKYPYFTLHHKDIRAEIPEMDECEAHECADFDEYFFTNRYICDIQLSFTHTPIITKWNKIS